MKLGDLVHVKAGKEGKEIAGIIVNIDSTGRAPIYEVLTAHGHVITVPQNVSILLMKEL